MSIAVQAEQIDLEEVIRKKNPGLLKVLPAFVLNYLKHVVHQDELNELLQRTSESTAHQFVDAVISSFRLSILSKGIENVPLTGGVIIACNHPLGGMDGIAMLKEVGNVRKDIRALSNDLLMNLKSLRGLLIPINKHGKNPAAVIRTLHAAYSSGECMIVFPAGLVSRLQDGRIRDLEWQKGFITQAVKYQRNIIPVYISAKNSVFFYTLAFLRKKLGIKANLEMFYLVDEAYRQRGKCVRVTFGEAIPWQTFTSEHSDSDWAQKVKQHVYRLRKGNTIFA